MGDSTAAGASTIDNQTRRRVFYTLVHKAEALTPSEIADEIDEPRQKVAYHLNSLVDMGLVVSEDGEYYCQPLFIDPSFDEAVESALADLTPEVERRIYLGEDTETEEDVAKILNCIRLSFTMSLFPEDFGGHN